MVAAGLGSAAADAKPSRKAFLQQEAAAVAQICVRNNFSAGAVAAQLKTRGYVAQPWFGKHMIGINYPGTKDAFGVLIHMPKAQPCSGIQVAPVRIKLVVQTMGAVLKKLDFAQQGRNSSLWTKGAQNVRLQGKARVNIGAGTAISGVSIRPE